MSQLQLVAYILYEEQAHLCAHCKQTISFYNSQLAHRIPQRKREIQHYGENIIHHKGNMKLVCSLACNDAVQAKRHEYDEIAQQIKDGVYGHMPYHDSQWES